MTFEQSEKHLRDDAKKALAASEEKLLSELFGPTFDEKRATEFYAGLEAAAFIAAYAGIKDVNIDCRSGANIAQKIRTLSATASQSPDWGITALVQYKAQRDAAFLARYDSTQGWTAYVAAKAAYEEAAVTFLDMMFDHN